MLLTEKQVMNEICMKNKNKKNKLTEDLTTPEAMLFLTFILTIKHAEISTSILINN